MTCRDFGDGVPPDAAERAKMVVVTTRLSRRPPTNIPETCSVAVSGRRQSLRLSIGRGSSTGRRAAASPSDAFTREPVGACAQEWRNFCHQGARSGHLARRRRIPRPPCHQRSNALAAPPIPEAGASVGGLRSKIAPRAAGTNGSRSQEQNTSPRRSASPESRSPSATSLRSSG